MNKKLIALAVSSAIAAPMAMADDHGPKVYGRINLALQVNDSGDDTTTDCAVSVFASCSLFKKTKPL